MVGRTRFELAIPWIRTKNQYSNRHNGRSVTKLDHRPVFTSESTNLCFKPFRQLFGEYSPLYQDRFHLYYKPLKTRNLHILFQKLVQKAWIPAY